MTMNRQERSSPVAPGRTRNSILVLKVVVLLLLALLVDCTEAFSGGWRVALNIGRESGTAMPSSWASSGARLPIVIPCDFIAANGEQGTNKVTPKSNAIRFTGKEGESIKPITAGSWALSNNRELTFTVSFPEDIVRNDVTIEAGTTLTMEGLVYTKTDLEELNRQFYAARDQAWQAMGEIEEVERRKEAPKKWNEATGQWERRYEDAPITSRIAQEFQLLTSQRQREKEESNRPRPKDLSLDCGPFPGVPNDDDVYVTMKNEVKMKSSFGPWRREDVVVGTWSAEPILDKAKSYYWN
jgi:hypothetical protein